jgi:hypothetical protein
MFIWSGLSRVTVVMKQRGQVWAVSCEKQLMLVEEMCFRQLVNVLQTGVEADWQLVAAGAC